MVGVEAEQGVGLTQARHRRRIGQIGHAELHRRDLRQRPFVLRHVRRRLPEPTHAVAEIERPAIGGRQEAIDLGK